MGSRRCKRIPRSVSRLDSRPVTSRGETAAVLRAGAVIFFGAWMWIGLHADRGGRAGETADLLPFQTLFRDLAPPLQRSFRAMQEGIIEAERARVDSKQWPAVEDLAANAIPPFAPDPLDVGQYRWTLLRSGAVVNYRGRSPNGAPELLLLVQEPEGGAIDPGITSAVADETHHLLSDGTLLHVTIWFRAAGGTDVRLLVDRPFAEGWTQILAGVAPSREAS